MEAALAMPKDSFTAVSLDRENLSLSLVESFSPWMDHHYSETRADDQPTYLDLAAALDGAGEAGLATPARRAQLAALFEKLDEARILTVARHGPLGCEALNRLGLNYMAGRHGLATDPGTRLFSGAPILITRNDYGRRLFNGDVGIVLVDDAGTLRIHVQRGRRYISTPLKTFKDWEPAFATTVHKSQGSEYTDVLLVLPGDPHHRLLSREILYTGITRARKRLLLVTRPDELQVALERRIERSSGLTWSG
jgi:exodeoxyribonuclease V alpha subunit